MQSVEEEIEHEGVIVRIDSGSARAFVRIEQQSACAMCHAKALCTASDMVEKVVEAAIQGNDSFVVGERVLIAGRKSLGFKAVLLAFVLPFCVLFVALYIAQLYIDNEAIAGTIALCALLPYFGIMALLRKRLAATFRFKVQKTSKI